MVETKEVKAVVESSCPHMEVARNGVLSEGRGVGNFSLIKSDLGDNVLWNQ